MSHLHRSQYILTWDQWELLQRILCLLFRQHSVSKMLRRNQNRNRIRSKDGSRKPQSLPPPPPPPLTKLRLRLLPM